MYFSPGIPVEEEDSSPQNAIDERHGAVEARILFVGGQSPHSEAGKDERHDDQVGSLHDLGWGLLPLINPWQLPVLGSPGSLDEGEGEDGEDHDGDVLADHEGGVHLEPAVVLACTVRGFQFLLFFPFYSSDSQTTTYNVLQIHTESLGLQRK